MEVFSGLWFAGKEGMEKNMEATTGFRILGAGWE